MDGLILLRLPASKFVKNDHQFTLALRLESFKDLEAVDIMLFGAIAWRIGFVETAAAV